MNPMGQSPGKLRPIDKNTHATNNEHNELNIKKSGHVNGLAYYHGTSASSKDLSRQEDGQTQGIHNMCCDTPLTEQSDGYQVSVDEGGEVTVPNKPSNDETESIEENPFLERYSETETTETERTDNESKSHPENNRKRNITRVKRKQGITIASWNTRGKNDENHVTKWKKIHRIMNLQKIAVLAVQESRTNEKDAKQIEEDNPGLNIINNGSHSNKRGVLFAINKRILKQEEKELEKTHKVLIKDRASMIEIEWGQDQKTKIVNIYAPNDLKEKVEFYRELNRKIKRKEMGEFCLMGDTNCVLMEIDRSPPHEDDEQITEQLKKLIRKNNLIDI